MLMEKAVKILCATRSVFEIVCRAVFSSSVHLGAITHIRLFSNLVSVDPDGVEDTAVV